MLPLHSSRWKELQHAYGSAENVPKLLLQAKTAPKPNNYKDEPWYSLWSALCHQGDVYTATYAAIPHLVTFALERPVNEQLEFLHLIGWTECCRFQKSQPEIPPDLVQAYQEAMARSKELFATALQALDWNEDEMRILLGGLAAVIGHKSLGHLIMEGLDYCNVCGGYFPTTEPCEHVKDSVH